MASGFKNLVIKEIKEMIRDSKTILGLVLMPLIMFPILGLAITISQSAVEESIKELSIALLDQDKQIMAKNLISSFQNLNITLMEMEASSVDEALRNLQESKAFSLLVIPYGFSQNLSLGKKAELETYSILQSISITEGTKSSIINTSINIYEQLIVNQAISEAFPDRSIESVLNPHQSSQLHNL